MKFETIKRYFAIITIVGVSVAGLALLDLYTFQLVLEDPGPYIVARRSDTPSQIQDALAEMEKNNFRDLRKLKILLQRYKQKFRAAEGDKAEKRKWFEILKMTVKQYRRAKRAAKSDTTTP